MKASLPVLGGTLEYYAVKNLPNLRAKITDSDQDKGNETASFPSHHPAMKSSIHRALPVLQMVSGQFTLASQYQVISRAHHLFVLFYSQVKSLT